MKLTFETPLGFPPRTMIAVFINVLITIEEKKGDGISYPYKIEYYRPPTCCIRDNSDTYITTWKDISFKWEIKPTFVIITVPDEYSNFIKKSMSINVPPERGARVVLQ